jgi:hypothetical protein
MHTRKTLFYLLAALMGGCVPVMSLHPLYEKDDVVFEQKLLGFWTDDVNDPDILWDFERPDPNSDEYRLIYWDKENNKGIFKVHLVKLDGKLFLDVYPASYPSGKDEFEDMKLAYNGFFFTPNHSFVKINSLDPNLSVQVSDDDELKKLLKDDPNAVKYEDVEDRGIVLTDSTKGLQAFVLKYADDERLFGDEVTLIRRENKSTEWPPVAEPNSNSTDQSK